MPFSILLAVENESEHLHLLLKFTCVYKSFSHCTEKKIFYVLPYADMQPVKSTPL